MLPMSTTHNQSSLSPFPKVTTVMGLVCILPDFSLWIYVCVCRSAYKILFSVYYLNINSIMLYLLFCRLPYSPKIMSWRPSHVITYRSTLYAMVYVLLLISIQFLSRLELLKTVLQWTYIYVLWMHTCILEIVI